MPLRAVLLPNTWMLVGMHLSIVRDNLRLLNYPMVNLNVNREFRKHSGYAIFCILFA